MQPMALAPTSSACAAKSRASSGVAVPTCTISVSACFLAATAQRSATSLRSATVRLMLSPVVPQMNTLRMPAAASDAAW